MTIKIPLPTQARLNELFNYYPETGLLNWRVSPAKSVPAGSKVGYPNEQGYLKVTVDGTKYMVHRLIWKLVTGMDPDQLEIDHIDHDVSNNAISNLRMVTRAQVQAGKKTRKDSKTGLKGVKKNKGCSSFHAAIQREGTHVHLGTYDTKEEAHAAYCGASIIWDAGYGRTDHVFRIPVITEQTTN